MTYAGLTGQLAGHAASWGSQLIRGQMSPADLLTLRQLLPAAMSLATELANSGIVYGVESTAPMAVPAAGYAPNVVQALALSARSSLRNQVAQNTTDAIIQQNPLPAVQQAPTFLANAAQGILNDPQASGTVGSAAAKTLLLLDYGTGAQQLLLVVFPLLTLAASRGSIAMYAT